MRENDSKKDKLLVDNYSYKISKKAEKDLEQHLNEILLIMTLKVFIQLIFQFKKIL